MGQVRCAPTWPESCVTRLLNGGFSAQMFFALFGLLKARPAMIAKVDRRRARECDRYRIVLRDCQ